MMETVFINTETNFSEHQQPKGASFKTDINTPGKITKTIGRGDDARNSFVYLTLRWAFIIGSIMTLLVVINNWYFVVDYKVPDIMTDISSIWDIVVPLITLALGYAFGKSKE